ncbi:hypothetical protein L1987_08414 [Smallanthus sonchifolius]|uniref:Uncharacterized protein n=1 Tax=Smallanthus sonchifolius TaxID=185202 RepID=A0ACB9JL07_9ASTR|nr:hypothetical protein L1987_08414 [Smallanthus sonchifolius]
MNKFMQKRSDEDVVSYTGDNVTPVSNTENNVGTSPLIRDITSTVVSTRKSLKRKLDDDYDIDDITTMSATKFSGRSIPNDKGGAKGDDNKKLLIPKIDDNKKFLSNQFSHMVNVETAGRPADGVH